MLMCLLMWAGAGTPAIAQNGRMYAGVLFGVSTLSADGRSIITPTAARVSLYKPENGLAVNAFAGVHLHRYFSLQANYMWNRNDLTLVSSTTLPSGGTFYEQTRSSTQHAFVADTLLYFRSLGSGIRPYLSTGLSVMRFTSEPVGVAVASGASPPTRRFSSAHIALRSAVGIDLSMSRGWSFRYSFSETIGGHPVSPHLSPPGERLLANFQNLFGIVRQF
jgi:hypothetical protein